MHDFQTGAERQASSVSSSDGQAKTVPAGLMQVRRGARIGTGSLRRSSQIRHHRPDLQILPIRGNIDTRLRKLQDGEYDAVVLAMAGLHRTRLFVATQMRIIEPDFMVPASCQGALALQCRGDDSRTEQRALQNGLLLGSGHRRRQR